MNYLIMGATGILSDYQLLLQKVKKRWVVHPNKQRQLRMSPYLQVDLEILIYRLFV